VSLLNMTSSAASTTPPEARPNWDQRVWAAKAPKSDINALILDYLTMEGYPKAAANFCKEANMKTPGDEYFTQTLWEVRQQMQRGDLQAAIETLNEIDPKILEGDEELHFLLLRLQLVEIIRDCDVDGGDIQHALEFARTNLGPRAAANPKFLHDLEKTMALLMIPRNQLEPPLAAMLDTKVRTDAAERVIGAIMATRSRRTMAGIRDLVKLRVWAENKGRMLSANVIPDDLSIYLNDDHENDTAMTT